MSPKMKTRSVKARSCKKSVPETKRITPKKSPPKKAKSKSEALQKTPKSKKKAEPVLPATPANSNSTPTEENKNSKKEDLLVTPKVMKYCLNAYKQSPEYDNLKKKRFNTGFHFENKRGLRNIEIFTPEEDNSPKWNENLPLIENKIQGEPGETYANIFMSIPGLDDSDKEEEEDEELEPIVETKRKCTDKKGRKKSIGFKGVPLPDECLITNYAKLLYSPE